MYEKNDYKFMQQKKFIKDKCIINQQNIINNTI